MGSSEGGWGPFEKGLSQLEYSWIRGTKIQNCELKNPGLTHGASPFSTSVFFGDRLEFCDTCVQNGPELCKLALSCCPSTTGNYAE